MTLKQDDLVFGSDLGFGSHKLTFFGNIASTARSYSRKTFTYIKEICKTKWLCNDYGKGLTKIQN